MSTSLSWQPAVRTARVIEAVRATRFVGRVDELEFLQERCNDARLGHGSLIFINGEAGIGKSRLVDELIRGTKATMAHVKGICFEHARSPLGPLADIVRTLHACDESILTVARTVRRVLARIVPELESLDAPDAHVQGARSQYAAIAELFRRFGERRPVVLAIEDAHWADVSTAEFLKYFAGKAGDSNVVLLVVTRTEPGDAAPFSPLIAGLRRQRAVHALDIEPLTRAQTLTMLRTASGAQGLAQTELHAICRLADGNPLFAEELLASALAKPAGALGLPPTISAIFAQRIERLEREDREILVEAAVFGSRFEPAFLASLTQRPLERILLALRHARALQLIVEDGEGHLAFRHALVRETLHASILSAEARGMHRRIVRELQVLPEPMRCLTALAYHSWAAGERDAALSYNERAGDDAIVRLAPNEAALAYERALSCTGADDPRRAELERKLGAAFSASGWSRRASDVYERAYASAVQTGDRESIAELCGAIGREYVVRGDGDAALRWLTAGLEAVESLADRPVRFAAFARTALALARRDDTARADAVLQRLGPADAPAASLARQDMLEARAALDVAAGRSAAALARYREATLEPGAQRSTALAVRLFCNYGRTAKVLGELEVARRAADAALRLADEITVPLYRPTVLADCGVLSAEAGDLPSARRRLAEAEDAAAGLDAPRVHARLTYFGLILARALDDPALDERYADESALDAAFFSCESWWIGALAYVFAERFGRLGRAADAQRLIGRALAVLPTLVNAHELAVAAAAYGAEADLVLARERLADWANHAVPAYGTAFVELFDAYGLRRGGRSPLALGVSAARRFELLGLPLWAAEAYEVAGERAAAIEIALRIGSSGTIARLSAPAAIDLPGAPLTKREREVLFLVSHGRSNRAIADELGISERTVESHIRAILAKVGGRSRHDIIKLAAVHALR